MYKRRMWAAFLLFLFSVSWANSFRYSKPTVTPFGTFKPECYVRSAGKRFSENGVYNICYERGHDNLQLINVILRKGDKTLFVLKEAPGSGAVVTNAGFLIITGENASFLQEFHHYSQEGVLLFSRRVKDPDLFEISPDGNSYAVGCKNGVTSIDISSGSTLQYPPADQCTFSQDGSLLALADGSLLYLFQRDEKVLEVKHKQFYVRHIAISPDNAIVAFVGQRELVALNRQSGIPLFSDTVSGSLTFRQIRLSNDELWAGIHNRDRTNRQSRGLLRTYSLKSRTVNTTEEALFQYNTKAKLNYNYGKTRNGLKELPWPFEPFDSPHKQWNGYLQLAASRDGTSGTYCHQGLDMDVPSYAKCYSIDSGYVKCKLTIMNPGDLYWRVAVSEVQTPDTSDGWLYAHLEKTTIGVDVGDVVLPGDYIGEIIPWNGLAGGHIHFARIRDHGSSWKYSDDQWWNVHSPLEQLRPLNDNSAPTIMDCFADSKFGIMTNDGDGWTQYIKPTEVSGQVDILVRVQEEAWQSPWLQPAYGIKYWMKNLDKDKIELDTTDGIKRKNSVIAQYSGELYNNLASAMYHITTQFKAKGWFTPNRDYVHIITNVTDTLVLSQNDIYAMEDKALNTALFADGNYRLYVEVYDAAYNSTLDSMDMVFNNGVAVQKSNKSNSFSIQSSVKSGKITLSISSPSVEQGVVRLLTLSGREISKQTVQASMAGTTSVLFNEQLATGTYLLSYCSENRELQRKILIQ